MRLLILGGTSEARALAGAVSQNQNFETTLSLAGRTLDPLDQGVATRVGGFGGMAGLKDYLLGAKIDLVVDVTHPFASQMSRHAREAAKGVGLPILHIERPEWVPKTGETWIGVPDLPAAVDILPTGARAFTATGRGSVEFFAARSDIYTFLRVIDPSPDPYPGNGEFVVARPPFTVAAEIEVLKHHRATHLVVKNAGGIPARTKLDAAAELGLPIVIVARIPLPDDGEVVSNVADALEWLARHARS